MQNDLSNPGAQQRVRILISARSENTRVNSWTANADKRMKRLAGMFLISFLFVNGYPGARHLDARLLDIVTSHQVTGCTATCQRRYVTPPGYLKPRTIKANQPSSEV
ncbi:hypothetical protein F5Y00DRAFT_120927 [Daldinia vernicosa]|uniref:uncharacterized protein n=1 Tax=Daldinia vernicosa TaxID=114800 RepID=UPI0020082A78|nr:uncharacterized protein F5Y00DRAFT_120927 [Daldinia vernicosa]KAI0847333.1 hypothetical protein F5Y00DRAFT_120927 [Daldinia vernicosa]